MAKKLRVALLCGGKSGEREVSLAGGREVASALDPAQYEVTTYDPAIDLARLTQDADRIDVAFILLHGPMGEDGTVQGFLELLGIPYQGSGVLGSALAMDKELAKQLYRGAGLTVPDAVVLQRGEPVNPDDLFARLGHPVVIKPVGQGSSLGMSMPADEPALLAGLAAAFNYGRVVMVEEFVRGREITVGVLGNDALIPLPLVEIIPGEAFTFFDFQAKYTPGASREVCPADFDPETMARAQSAAMAAHRALRLRGYSRTDMIVANSGLYVLETNTIPGMTPTSLLPQAAAVHGLPFPRLLDRLIELALEGKEML